MATINLPIVNATSDLTLKKDDSQLTDLVNLGVAILSGEVTATTLVSACLARELRPISVTSIVAPDTIPNVMEPVRCSVAAQKRLWQAHEQLTLVGEVDEDALDFMDLSNKSSPHSQDILYICSNSGDLIQLQEDNTYNNASTQHEHVSPIRIAPKEDTIKECKPAEIQDNFVNESLSFIAPTPSRTRSQEVAQDSKMFIHKGRPTCFSFPEAPTLNNTLGAMNTALLAIAKLYEIMENKMSGHTSMLELLSNKVSGIEIHLKTSIASTSLPSKDYPNDQDPSKKKKKGDSQVDDGSSWQDDPTLQTGEGVETLVSSLPCVDIISRKGNVLEIIELPHGEHPSIEPSNANSSSDLVTTVKSNILELFMSVGNKQTSQVDLAIKPDSGPKKYQKPAKNVSTPSLREGPEGLSKQLDV